MFNIYKPIKFYINHSVRKETISHLTMDIILTLYAIIYVGKRFKNIPKGCVRYICASLYLSCNESTGQTRKNAFYFTSKALSILEKIKF